MRVIKKGPVHKIDAKRSNKILSALIGYHLRTLYAQEGINHCSTRFIDLIQQLSQHDTLADQTVNDQEFKHKLLKTLSSLKAFAMSLTGNHARSDDLVQETLLKAWQHRQKFQLGTNLNAWLFTILRNIFYSNHRKYIKELEDTEGAYALKLSVLPNQEDKLMIEDLQKNLNKLTYDQREALYLVGAEGITYEEAAEIMNCKIGTIKSRVSRARMRLINLVDNEEKE